MTDPDPATPPSGAEGGAPPSPPTPPAEVTAPETEPPETSSQDELKAFMEEYRADKRAAAEAAEAKAKADAEAEAKKKKVPAPEPKKKAAPKPAEPVTESAPKERAYGSARYFNRKSKRVKE